MMWKSIFMPVSQAATPSPMIWASPIMSIPAFRQFNYAEIIGKLGTTVGPATVGGTFAYAPSQDGTGNTDNVYIGTNASIALP
jgi:hypothetical protein